ncbi:predicted protein [Sclerotinia sclerotiorum 1980 UF-70]|uniref:Uncharacterized protein n=1 Tax=Sclerotinia sclerotiorum (strain ATCC 18683 / 1980 / Ss-1) TaxID=665079 RepID=A7F3F9_SCLS1|nr:predicted protein [Sclerotinia sclerotiorum 1980 UF-70]EDN97280.1 predicted protein [Sclerotinia sclerotiorum 1980 UF-70]
MAVGVMLVQDAICKYQDVIITNSTPLRPVSRSGFAYSVSLITTFSISNGGQTSVAFNNCCAFYPIPWPLHSEVYDC